MRRNGIFKVSFGIMEESLLSEPWLLSFLRRTTAYYTGSRDGDGDGGLELGFCLSFLLSFFRVAWFDTVRLSGIICGKKEG